jgi:hypothetical protein
LLCSNCGYENPREHRYCGMCGTPFPYRTLTVPGAQSTLSFTSLPVELASTSVVEPAVPAAEERKSTASEPVGSASPEPELVEETGIGTQAGAVEERVSLVDEPAAVEEEPISQETFAEVAEPPTTVIPEAGPETRVEPPSPEPSQVVADEFPESSLESTAPPEPPISEPEPPPQPPPAEPEPEEPPIREPEPEAPEVIREPPPQPETKPAPKTGRELPLPVIKPQAPAPQPAAPRVAVMPPPRSATLETPTVAPQTMAKIHPPPDSLPISSPPSSSGMPTFKEVSEASGPPDISPFEPPEENHSAEDQDLKQFVANFRWTPPAETADELTMRSEVPVIDKEAPAQFHHPSFDDDVAPPPEAGPHPTGQEYYEADGTAPRPRFLEVGEKSDGQPVASGRSFLGLDDAPSQTPPTELAGGSKSRGWLWASILALIAIFGGLGYLEGRAQSTHEFRGPVQFVREEYSRLRERLLAKAEPTATVPEIKQPEEPKAAEPRNPQDNSTQPAATEPDAAQETQPQASNSDSHSQPEDTPAAGGTQPSDNGAGTTPADTAPAKPLEMPPTNPATSKPQPGQQELARALNASDSAAAAAWLWKATSRGNPEAPVRLADMFLRCNGVPKSCEQALVLLRSAAAKENAPARNRMAALYANGTCVVRDPVKAYQLMSSALAVDPTSEWAKENRQQLWSQMTPEQRAEAQKNR